MRMRRRCRPEAAKSGRGAGWKRNSQAWAGSRVDLLVGGGLLLIPVIQAIRVLGFEVQGGPIFMRHGEGRGAFLLGRGGVSE